MHHYLRPLVSPASIALVGASEREGSLGRVVYENLLSGGFQGPIYAINPRHETVLGRPAHASLKAVGAPIDLAVVATPEQAVVRVLEDAAAVRVKVAVVMTSPSAVGTAATRAWSDEIAQAAMRGKVRVVGPGAFGVVRTPTRIHATYAPRALPGRLALITQSGAVATAMLDFATPLRVGFSTIVSVGGGVDIGFGELLDLLISDPQTDGIVVHIEEISDARTFVSALRAAARTKPVVVLKTGRSLEPREAIPHDEVFAAALQRSGTVRVDTYTQLFAAARILARGRVPQGTRVAIVSNGRGPAVMAADRAFDRHLELAPIGEPTAERLEGLLGHPLAHTNPVDVRGDAAPTQLAAAAGVVLDDPVVDAVIALHVPRPGAPAVEAAHALASVAATHRKPVLAAWLGAIDSDVHAALDAGGVANFYTPETSVEALSFLVEYRNNQTWLLEAPPPSPEPQPLDLGSLEDLRVSLVDAARSELRPDEGARILAIFGLAGGQGRAPAKANDGDGYAVTAGIATDRRFGPVVFVAPAVTDSLAQRRALMLPPLSTRLATDLLAQACDGLGARIPAPAADALVAALTRLSALACALPWVRTLTLDLHVAATPERSEGPKKSAPHADIAVANARFDVQPQCKLMRGYPHVAIHPYPVELIGDVTLRDGTSLHVRPIRPEDAPLERAFVEQLSEQTRYYRFFHRLSELTPSMLARFTQVDYDRELALVAIRDAGTNDAAFVGVARYVANPDRTTAEFAIVVADDWQRRGVGAVLMRGLIVCAKRRGFDRLEGAVLRENERMVEFVRTLGFTPRDDPEDPAAVIASLALQDAT